MKFYINGFQWDVLRGTTGMRDKAGWLKVVTSSGQSSELYRAFVALNRCTYKIPKRDRRLIAIKKLEECGLSHLAERYL